MQHALPGREAAETSNCSLTGRRTGRLRERSAPQQTERVFSLLPGSGMFGGSLSAPPPASRDPGAAAGPARPRLTCASFKVPGSPVLARSPPGPSSGKAANREPGASPVL